MKASAIHLLRSNYWLAGMLCFLTIRTAFGVQNYVVVWGSGPVTNVPADVTNVASAYAGGNTCFAVMRDGRLRAWGASTNIPASATNVIAVSSTGPGLNWSALRRDGTVINYQGVVGAVDSVALAGASYSTYALKRDGTVTLATSATSVVATNAAAIAGGGYDRPQVLFADGTVPSIPYITPINIVAIADRPASLSSYFVALQHDGTVVTGSGPSRPPDLSNVVVIAAGAQHGLALKSDGSVVAWGNNSFGQTNVPAGLDSVVAIAAGDYHSLALRADGTVVAWGNNSKGQTNVPAGLTNVAAVFAGPDYSTAIVGESPPTLLTQPPDVSIWPGQTATFTVKTIGTAPLRFQWQLNGEFIEGATNSWCRVDRASSNDAGIYSVVVSNSRGVAVSREAFLILRQTPPVILSQPVNQTGFPGTTVSFSVAVESSPPVSYQWLFNDQPITGANNSELLLTNLTSAAAGEYRVLVSNAFGTRTSSVARLSVALLAAWGRAIPGLSDASSKLRIVGAIAAGSWNGVALTSEGTALAWGYGVTNIPPDRSNVVAISTGGNRFLMLREDGTAFMYGNGYSGEYSLALALSNIVSIATGDYQSLFLLNDGTVMAAGDNSYGQTNVPPGLSNVVSVSAGVWHCMALCGDGSVVVWGGSPMYGLTNVPQDAANAVAIAAGSYHCLALKSDGTVVAWGDNNYGQCSVPGALSNVLAIAAGSAHSLTMRDDGTVAAWGDNYYGQVTVPHGLSKVVAIAAGGVTSLALTQEALSAPTVTMGNPNKLPGTFSLPVATVRGKSYYLQHRDSFNNSRWMMRTPVPGDGSVRTLVDPDANAPQRFYRVWQKP